VLEICFTTSVTRPAVIQVAYTGCSINSTSMPSRFSPSQPVVHTVSTQSEGSSNQRCERATISWKGFTRLSSSTYSQIRDLLPRSVTTYQVRWSSASRSCSVVCGHGYRPAGSRCRFPLVKRGRGKVFRRRNGNEGTAHRYGPFLSSLPHTPGAFPYTSFRRGRFSQDCSVSFCCASQ